MPGIKTKNGKIVKNLPQVKRDITQAEFIESITDSLAYNVTTAAELTGVKRATISTWFFKDKEFAAKVKEIFAENKTAMNDEWLSKRDALWLEVFKKSKYCIKSQGHAVQVAKQISESLDADFKPKQDLNLNGELSIVERLARATQRAEE